MPVIAPIADCNINAAAAFYRAEAFNVGLYGALLALTSTRTIAVTFANAGQLKKVILALSPPITFASASTFRQVTVTLRESGISRATVTISGANILNNIDFSTPLLTSPGADNWILPFEGFDYTIDTVPAKWTLDVTSTGAEANTLSIRTSDGTNPFYAAFCDNAISYTANDTLIADRVVTINANTNLRGLTGTGDATRANAAIICKAASSASATVANLVWQAPASASYTLTVDGFLYVGAHAGFRVGTVANPIAIANRAIVTFVAATVGASTNTGLNCSTKANLFLRGEIPSPFISGTYEDTTLAANIVLGGTATMTIASPCVVTRSAHGYAANMPVYFSTTGALPTGVTAGTVYFVKTVAANTFEISATSGGASINTTGSQSGVHTLSPAVQTVVSTGWTAGDRIYIGKCSSQTADNTIYIIATVTGAIITTTVAIGAQARTAGGAVVRAGGYGVTYSNPTTAIGNTFGWPTNIKIFGCLIQNVTLNMSGNAGVNNFGPGDNNREIWEVRNSCHEYTATAGVIFGNGWVPPQGITFDNVKFLRGTISGLLTVVAGSTGTATINNCKILGTTTFSQITSPLASHFVMTNNVFEHNAGGNTAVALIQTPACSFTGNSFWGHASNFSLSVTNLVSVSNWSGNRYNRCNSGIRFTGNTVKVVATDELFGNEFANIQSDIDYATNIFLDFELRSPTGNVVVATTNQKGLIAGSRLSIQDYNDAVNDDRNWYQYGFLNRTGFALGDTTVWTGTAFGAASSGQFGIRFQPNDGTNPLVYLDNAGATTIGNCQNLPVVITARVKINNAAYYAGTNQLPRLSVTFDGATTVTHTAAATTADQLLQVTFTPTTTTQAITIAVSGATDATTTNAYFYLGEIVVLTPSGVLVDTTRAGSWRQGLPLGTSRTFPSPSSVFDEPVAKYDAANTFGKYIKDIRKRKP